MPAFFLLMFWLCILNVTIKLFLSRREILLWITIRKMETG